MLFDRRIKTHHMGKKLMSFSKGFKNLGDVLDTEGEKDQVIYIHTPYCSNICSFCNMNRSLNTPHKEYVDMLIEQLKYLKSTKRFNTSTISSVYFGGGTPTVLSQKDLEKILIALKQYAPLNDDCEITMETSLSDLTDDKFKVITQLGVNRLSIGVQTFDDKGRILLNRRENGTYAKKRLEYIRNKDFSNVNIDLIYNYPTQSIKQLKNDLEAIKALDIAGFSFYSLIIMQESKLGRTDISVDESIQTDKKFFDYIMKNKDPYDFLEITKLVKKERDQYRYIKDRIKGKDTFAVGMAAGGNIENCMCMNPMDINKYKDMVKNPSEQKLIEFDPEYFKIKKTIDQLQLLKINKKDIINEAMLKHIHDYIKEGLMIEESEFYKLTEDGVFFGNNIIDSLWDIEIKSYNNKIKD